jgi:WD40 repeat protein
VTLGIRAELIHPNRRGILVGIRYSSDGRRIIAGDDPSSTIQTWDVATGRQLAKIEVGRFPNYQYFAPTPDCAVVYTPHGPGQRRTRFERDGKVWTRFEFDGSVQAWDTETGRLLRMFRHTPPRGIRIMWLSPDGSTFVTYEELPGDWPNDPGWTKSLWDVKSNRYRVLQTDATGPVLFARDGQTLALADYHRERRTTSLRLLDVATVREKRSIPVAPPNTTVALKSFTPDGKVLIGSFWTYPGPGEQKSPAQAGVKCWDTGSGREVASFPMTPPASRFAPQLSPDGKTLVVASWHDQEANLLIFDLPGRKLRKSVPLVDRVVGNQELVVQQPAVSPDGRSVAVITQAFPAAAGNNRLEPEDTPQPRTHLIDVRAGAVRQVLVAPQGFSASACFSPDGKTLAVGGLGKVLLWDLTPTPSAAAARPGR